ncbi:hypothetical protein PI124_g15909 [Phytophthora idaei]|nr:hypothetical protein PI124_g15909 [Phytophthora idaei]
MYEETIPNQTKGDTDDNIVPIKTTFDEGLLRMRCRLLWRLSIGNVTDEPILTEIDKIISSAKNNSVPDGDREMREMLRMNLFGDLKSLGIDIDQQLEQLAVRNEDEREADPKEDIPSLAPSLTDDDLQAALERMIVTALEHGFSSHLESQLRAIVL